MDNSDIKVLVDTFRGYRELLVPVQSNLHDFVETYDSMKEDIGRLNNAFEGDIKGNLEKIYLNLSSQAARAADLSSRIEQFIKMTEKYSSDVARLASSIDKVAERVSAVNELENRAEQQIGKLDEILEEKRKSYNIKELQRTLDNYDANVQRVGDFINKDIAEALTQNYNRLESIRTSNDALSKRIKEERSDIENLLAAFMTTNAFLKQAIEN